MNTAYNNYENGANKGEIVVNIGPVCYEVSNKENQEKKITSEIKNKSKV